MKRVEQLVAELEHASQCYYKDGDSPLTDEQFDAKVTLLRALAPENEFFQSVGANIKGNNVAHPFPMGSLKKFKDVADVEKWLQQSDSLQIYVAPKYDGFGLELIYKDGLLVSATTRGNGEFGEDVTAAAKTIKSIPTDITESSFYREDPIELLTVRGEAIIHTAFSETFKSKGYSTLRNAVPGIVRSNNQELMEYVSFVAYNFHGFWTNHRPVIMEKVRDTFEHEVYMMIDAEDLSWMKKYFEDLRNDLGYEIDGLVLKTEWINVDKEYLLYPETAVAWKFGSEIKPTILRKIEYSMGPTGKHNPVAVFDPVELGGAQIGQASIGSMGRLAQLIKEGLMINCAIDVTRRGDVIPYVEGVSLDSAFTLVDLEPIPALNKCAHCGSELVNDTCENLHCQGKLHLKLVGYIKSIGIKGVASNVLQSLIQLGYLRKISDLYNVADRVDRDGNVRLIGPSALSKLETLSKKRLSALDLLNSYPFENLGASFFASLTSVFTLEELFEEDLEEIGNKLRAAQIKGLGESKIADFLSQWPFVKEDVKAIRAATK